MKYTYDFHIHTALSPCGDELMTPNNIVNMCKLNEIQVIAITDHNTCANCKVVMDVGAQQGVVVIPGMEIECMEEFHNIALFPDLKSAEWVEKRIKGYLPRIKNRVNIFGNQCLFNEKDEIIGEVEQLLVTACQLSAQTIYEWVKEVGGVIYPAHIDRPAYSIISTLGTIPSELATSILEISPLASMKNYLDAYKEWMIIQSSDAHYLEQLCKENNEIDLPDKSVERIVERLKIIQNT